MRRDSNLLHRQVLVPTAMVIFCSCSAYSVPTQVAAASEELPPAKLMTLTGEPAAELGNRFGYSKPVAWAYSNAQEHWVAVVFTKHQADFSRLFEELIVRTDAGPGCPHEGAVACCDSATGTFKLSTELNGEPVWIDLGEHCELVPVDPDTPDDDYQGNVEQAELTPELSQALFECCGIDDQIVNLATRSGEARVLVKTQSQSGTLGLMPSLTRWSGPRESSRIILVHDHSALCPAAIATPPACCKKDGGDKRCHKTRRHWYQRVSGAWCRDVGCDCNDCR
jgi:hypothetical protein